VEALIQELPKFRLKAVPTDCSECPICLEEFHVGNEVDIFLYVSSCPRGGLFHCRNSPSCLKKLPLFFIEFLNRTSGIV
jgi:hypothetical protein